MKTKRIAIYFSVLFALAGEVQSTVTVEAPSLVKRHLSRTYGGHSMMESTNRVLESVEVKPELSEVMSNIEYQACMDHCVADFIKCKGGC